MSQWWIILVFFAIWGLLYLLIRNDYDKKNGLSKKGFIKMISSIVVMIAVGFVLGLLAGR